MSIQEEVDRLIDERPGRELLHPDFDEKAVAINDFIYRSAGSSASTMIVTSEGRVVVNTGMGFEAAHHKQLFDAICPGPTPFLITTQGHVDHVGGIKLFREPATRYIAQESNPACQADDSRIQAFRGATALRWFPNLPKQIRELTKRYAATAGGQDKPTPDITFEERMAFKVGGLDIELIAMPGGETVDSLAVWLPEYRIVIMSNLLGPLFPHFPNFNTLRGDKYRFAVPYMKNVQRLRALRPKMLITGRGLPIEGEELIDACMGRLHDAVDYVHQKTLDGINAGKDVFQIMEEVKLPAELRVGQGYGKVSWGVRAIWENYAGWFKHNSTTELYAQPRSVIHGDLIELAGGPQAIVQRAQEKLDALQFVEALHLLDILLPEQRSRREKTPEWRSAPLV